MKKNSYQNYFTNHYKVKLTEKDILDFEKWFLPQWKIINSQISIKENTSVLEIGSGVGGVFSLLKKKGEFDYTGIELDEKAVQFTNRFFKTNCFKVSPIEEFNVTKKYDYIFAFEVLEHLENPLLAVSKIASLLKKGGYFIGTTPYPYKKNIIADKTHLSVLHPDNWKRLFMLNNLTDIRLSPLSFPPFIWRIHSSLHSRIPFYISWPGFISTTLIIAKKNNA